MAKVSESLRIQFVSLLKKSLTDIYLELDKIDSTGEITDSNTHCILQNAKFMVRAVEIYNAEKPKVGSNNSETKLSLADECLNEVFQEIVRLGEIINYKIEDILNRRLDLDLSYIKVDKQTPNKEHLEHILEKEKMLIDKISKRDEEKERKKELYNLT